MVQGILSLPPEIVHHICKYCYATDLISLACCSREHYASLQHLLWRRIIVTKRRMERDVLTPRLLKQFRYTKDLHLFDYGTNMFYPGWLCTAINCKNILNNCDGNLLSKLNIKTICSDRILKLMSTRLINLKELKLRSCLTLTSVGWQQFVHFQTLNRLTIRNCSLFDKDVKAITKLKCLRDFSIVECQLLSDLSMKYIGELAELKRLMVSSNRYITPRGLVHITRLVNLLELDLSFSSINDQIISLICAVPIPLKKLDISLCSDITDYGIMELSTLKTLQQLNIQDYCVSKSTLLSFCRNTGMKEMSKYSPLCDDVMLKR